MTIKIQIDNQGELKSAVVEVKNFDMPVLDIAEDGGLKLPYGCRSGSCGSCRVEVLKGLEMLESRTPIEEDTLMRCKDPETVRLACRARFLAGSSGELELRVAPVVTVEIE